MSARAFTSLSAAIAKGFFRDRGSVFFAIVFPLMFLVLFGGVLSNPTQSRIDLIQVGEVSLIDDFDAATRAAFEDTFEVTRSTDAAGAVDEVRTGDADVALQMVDGETVDGELVAHYTETDQTAAAITRGALQAFVDGANVAASGRPPTYALRTERVEDDSLETIQFVTPGLLGWAVAMSASFGAAATLQGWRQSKLLRRLQLAPVSTRTVVAARIAVTVGIALVQMAIFLGLGVAAFGLKLTGSWPLAIPLVVVGTLCFMAVGLLAGAVAKTTEGAVNMANFLVLPMAFLSGSFFSLDGAPGWLQTVSSLMPLRHLNDGMLDVMVRDQGWAGIGQPMAILAGFAIVVTLIAARLFRWDAD
ncbi:ABC transporter permease [Nocardioides pacificus]